MAVLAVRRRQCGAEHAPPLPTTASSHRALRLEDEPDEEEQEALGQEDDTEEELLVRDSRGWRV